MASRTRMHRCPGKCERMVPHQFFACGGCWARLPLHLQQAIKRAPRRSGAHVMAMAEACDWYREHEDAQQPGDDCEAGGSRGQS